MSMEKPLRHGLALLAIQLEAASGAVLVTRQDFDYDGMSERIETIRPLLEADDRAAIAEALLAEFRIKALGENPELKPDPRSVLPLEVMPATLTRIPGTFPAQQLAVRLANDPLYEAVYLRAHVIESGGAGLLDTILGMDGIQESLVDYIHRLGSSTPGAAHLAQ